MNLWGRYCCWLYYTDGETKAQSGSAVFFKTKQKEGSRDSNVDSVTLEVMFIKTLAFPQPVQFFKIKECYHLIQLWGLGVFRQVGNNHFSINEYANDSTFINNLRGKIVSCPRSSK